MLTTELEKQHKRPDLQWEDMFSVPDPRPRRARISQRGGEPVNWQHRQHNNQYLLPKRITSTQQL
jgi:hypothetical protein